MGDLPAPSNILPVDQVYHHPRQHVLLVRPAFGNQQRHGHQRIVGNALAAVGAVKRLVLLQESQKQCRRDVLVAVHEAVVLHQKVEQVAAFSSRLG